jgi:tetratricopeptide (TPR) repeat protein/NAD-dependent dihydropyrimidine dehydrogenase PreA subunit
VQTRFNKGNPSPPALVPQPVTGPTRTGPRSIRPSKTSKWRALALGILNLAMIAHFVQWRFAGKTISPIEPSESMQTLQHGAINAGFIFFSLAILATLIFGRFVCGWGCHILALQDFCAWLLNKMGITPKPFRSRLLIYVPLIAALYMFVWPTFYRLFLSADPGPLLPHFTNHLVTDNFWATFPTVAVAIPFLFICGFMTVYFLGMKGFCSYACPYGGFFGLADTLAPGKIRVTDACEQCGHCTAVCTSNVLVHAEVKHYGMVVDPGCMKCMDCISVCPKDALYFGWGKPSLLVPKTKAIPRNYSLTWPEEIVAALVFLGSFLGVRSVYGLVPFLMALGCAAVTTFLFLKTWHLFSKADVYFHKFSLKFGGKIHRAGWAFLVFAVAWIGLAAHSGWIRYNEFRGDQAFHRLQVPDELALAQLNPARWLRPTDRESIASGLKHLGPAARFGLFTNETALGQLAWFKYLSGDANAATQILARAAAGQSGESKALSLYYRGAILNRVGQYNEAITSLDEALAERDNLILARQEKGEALWQLGRKDEAVAVWSDALQRNPNLVLVNDQMAGAFRQAGRLTEAAAYEQQADSATPNDALYHAMLGLRLENVGMRELAEKHFAVANQLDARTRPPVR